MNRRLLVAAAVLLCWTATPAFAHRLDEYLQAATIDVSTRRVAVEMRLTPGVAVLRSVLAGIYTDGNGTLSPAEQRAYPQRVLDDLSLTIDAKPVPLRLVSSTFPELAEMREGLGEIVLEFEADVPDGGGADRRMIFENRHQRAISAYLANCLLPSDAHIRITAQHRNYEQSVYQVDYTQGSADAPRSASRATPPGSARSPASRASLFQSYLYHGVHHILTGYDHLLFVIALVLAATTLWDLLKVVSTFTLAHTITLTLAALDLVNVPGRVVEPFIAASIVFVAVQNVVWPSRARGWGRLAAAFFFGLFHGLGFAGGLLNAMREMPGATVLLAILAFSVGVEAGHQMVVLPLFAALKAARQTQTDAVTRTRLAMALQRVGSAGISVAGVYYLCLALGGAS